MQIDELLNLLDIKSKIKNKKINQFKIDTRDINKDDVFIAINNGYKYIDTKTLKKCSLIIVDKDIQSRENIVKVKDTKEVLLKIASYIRDKYQDIPLIAITGSVGKTTTKELIATMLEKKYNVLKTTGNHNNNIGVPITLFNLNDKTDICVIEMGMNHQNEISILSQLAKPNISIITNILSSHIGYLKSKKNIFKAKCEIIDGMSGGYLIVNGNDKYLKKVELKHIEVIKTGLNQQLFRLIDIKEAFNSLSFKLNINDTYYQVNLKIPKYFLDNILIAITTALLCEIDPIDIVQSLETFKLPDARCNIIYGTNSILISDCYNASYESTISVLEEIDKSDKDKILILGEIKELGKYSKKTHLKLGKYLKNKNYQHILLVGENTKYIKKIIKNSVYFENLETLFESIKNIDLNNKIILVKGSRTNKLEVISQYIEDRLK